MDLEEELFMSEDNKTKKSKNSGCFLETIFTIIWFYIFAFIVIVFISTFNEKLGDIFWFIMLISIYVVPIYYLLRPLYRAVKKYKE